MQSDEIRQKNIWVQAIHKTIQNINRSNTLVKGENYEII